VIYERTTILRAPLPRVFEFFAEPGNLARITPVATRFRIVAGPDRCLREGDRIEYRLRVFGLPWRWASRIESWRENEFFSDVQERGPYKSWRHTHTFRETADGVEMYDRVEYELPLGILGRLAAGGLVRRELKKIFGYRGRAITYALTNV
jgi:ligand-binding SRPBCC domain-containing protein